jgi:ATP-binding cassette subfamily B protein
MTTSDTASPRFGRVRTALRALPRAGELIWQASPRGAAALAVALVAGALLPVGQAWLGKLIVDVIVAGAQRGGAPATILRDALPLLVGEFVLIALAGAISELSAALRHVLGGRVRHRLSLLLIDKALDLDLQAFEQPAYYDKLQNARREGAMRAWGMIDLCQALGQSVITLVAFAVVLAGFSLPAALLLLAAGVPALLAQMRHSNRYVGFIKAQTATSRKMLYLEHLLTADTSAKEVRLFGLGEPLLARFERLFADYERENVRLRSARARQGALLGMVTSAGYYAAYAWVIWGAASGQVTIGDLVLYLLLARQARTAAQGLFTALGQLYEHGLFLDTLDEFLAVPRRVLPPANPCPMPRPIRSGIEFRNVSYRYPESASWALRDVCITLRPGETIALVGANGAGKTTFARLLLRLDDPTEGQILIDGVDLREIDMDELRGGMAALFQDFVHYHVSARENIGFGQHDALEDQQRIVAAARNSSAEATITALPHGYDTTLGRWFERGQNLSGGQWQLIGLARALVRKAEVIVLDEPTAALDANHEAEIAARLGEIGRGTILLVMTHRLSLARDADRVAVFDSGRLAELGPHDELMAQGGLYARLFARQSQGYAGTIRELR